MYAWYSAIQDAGGALGGLCAGLPALLRGAGGLGELPSLRISTGTYVAILGLSAIPYLVAAVGMVVIGRNSDRTGERRWHIALTAIVGGAGFALAGVVHGIVPSIAGGSHESDS